MKTMLLTEALILRKKVSNGTCSAAWENVSSTSLMEELELQLEEMQDNYDSPQDLADDLCNEVARLFNGTWSYIAQAGRIDIRV